MHAQMIAGKEIDGVAGGRAVGDHLDRFLEPEIQRSPGFDGQVVRVQAGDRRPRGQLQPLRAPSQPRDPAGSLHDDLNRHDLVRRDLPLGPDLVASHLHRNPLLVGTGDHRDAFDLAPTQREAHTGQSG